MRTYDNFREAYPSIIDHVLSTGVKSAPRGMATIERMGYQFALRDPADVLIRRKGWSDPFAAAEAIQLIGGFSDPDMLARINPTMLRFFQERDNRTYQHGAYGPRIRDALPKLIERLKSDEFSRQALLTVYNANTDYIETPDVPCTIGFQFFLRNDSLLMIASMRSNDLYWGTPYDVFQFTQLQLTVARILDVPAGQYIHQAGSLHLYERDREALAALVESGPSAPRSFHPVGIGEPGEAVDTIQRVVQRVRREYPPHRPTPSEMWYHEQLQYVSPRAVE